MSPETQQDGEAGKKRPDPPGTTQTKKVPKKAKTGNPAADGGSDAKAAKPSRPKKKDKKDKEPESLLTQSQDAILPIPSVRMQEGRRIPAKRIEDILLFALDANTYLHTLQAERGVSTCYVAGKGQVLQELLLKVRKDTDAAAEKLKQCDVCVEMVGGCSELLRAGALKQFRKEVDFLESPFLQVLTGYNMLIDGFLEEIFKLINPLHSIDIGMVLGCYNSFLYLKDMIGRMRATVGCILSDRSRRSELSSMGHLTLVANIGAQKAFTKAFISTGISPDIRLDFMNFCRDCPPEVTMVERSLMVSREAAWKVMSQMTPEGWFQTMSQRLNALNKIQQKLTLNILETARKYCAKRKEAAEEKRASRAAKAARERAAAEAASSNKEPVVATAAATTRAEPARRVSNDAGSPDDGDITAGERLLQVLSSMQDEDMDMDATWADQLGNEATWLPTSSAPSASMQAPLPQASSGLSSLSSLFPANGTGSAMASIMPPQPSA